MSSTAPEHAFPTLSDEQIEALQAYGRQVSYPKGAAVWRAGDADVCMFVVVKGGIQVVDGRTQRPIVRHGARNFSGDIDVITGRPSMVSAIADENSELLVMQGDCVRRIVGEQPGLGETILRAFLMRRAMMQQGGLTGVLIVGSRYSAETLHLREFLARSRVPMIWQDVESDPDARRTLEEFGVCEAETPLVVLPHGEVMKSPSTAALAQTLGILRSIDGETVDVVVVGAGPAGLAAAVYGASEGLKTLVVDADGPGGQAGTSSRIENYMGFPLGISGQELADGATAQAEKFGARFVAPATTLSLTCADAGMHEVSIEGMGKVATRCVILASGARYRKIGLDNEADYEGRGIYYACTNVERVLCGKSPVAIVGAGNSAGQAAVFMSQGEGHVFLVVRGDDLRKSMSSYLAVRIESLVQEGRMTLLLETEVCALRGDHGLSGATLRNRRTGEARDEPIEAIFVMIGADPRTEWLRGGSKVELDDKGFILTGNDVVARELWRVPGRSPYFLETSCPGVFAVGDARSGSVKRVASAVGEGSMAIALAHQYLATT